MCIRLIFMEFIIVRWYGEQRIVTPVRTLIEACEECIKHNDCDVIQVYKCTYHGSSI